LTPPPPAPHRSGFVAVVGRPNVGKSSLINHYLEQKIAIVSDKPQTTRQTQLGIITRPEAQLIFVDTPGLHDPKTELGQYMTNEAARSILDADVVLFMADVSLPPNADDARLAELLTKKPGLAPVIIALNKSDRLKPEHVILHSDAYRALVPEAPWLLVSAKRGDNLDELLRLLLNALPEGPVLYPEDEVTQTHLRDLAGEFIREAALNALDQEVPHGIAVEVDEFKERPQNTTYISAVIYVERESHKKIVIGKGAEMLKKIGMTARQAIERLLEDRKAFLELRVKVRPHWRKDKREVERLGYKRRE